MRVAYTSTEDPKTMGDMNADHIFADGKGTNWIERHYLFDKGGFAEGDTVIVRQKLEFGRGAARYVKMIEERGATLELCPSVVKRPTPGRPPKHGDIPAEQLTALKTLWHSAFGPKHVLARAKAITGKDIDRAWMFRAFGPRTPKTTDLKERTA